MSTNELERGLCFVWLGVHIDSVCVNECVCQHMSLSWPSSSV